MQNFNRSLAGFVLLAVVGCGPADGRVALSGKVMMDGQPATGASISFRPLRKEGNTAGIMLDQGRFELSADKGLLPGKYLVSVQAYRETGRTFDDPQRGSKMPELVPVQLLSIDPAEIEIAADQPNVFEIRASTR
jgi:hypothetical protein